MNNSTIFWIDEGEISYSKFTFDILKAGVNNVYIKDSDPYIVFLNIIRNFINDKQPILLDADFSDVELVNLNITGEIFQGGSYTQSDLSSRFNNFEDILSFLNKNKSELSLNIFTSGTTGRPKNIVQSLQNTIKGVRVEDKFKDNIWGFAYNPTHFAGLQVFFQALFNKNTIVYLFIKDFSEIANIISDKSITNISSTPSFIKMLLPNIDEPILSLKRMTFGGEQFDNSVLNRIKTFLPNVRLKNVYASTEAGSLLVSEGDSFKIPTKYLEYIKIEEDELLIHSKLMGKSDSLELKGDWYYSGDLVNVFDDNSFKFRARKSEMITVGGYKVNPREIEDLIKDIDGVLDAKVYGRKNSVLGYVVASDIIKEENIERKELKRIVIKKCNELLQEFKTPRIIKFVESFEMTRTGKIKR